jgi:hypothetical protein
MNDGPEAAADVLTGAIVAGAVEPHAGAAAPAAAAAAHGACRNCGAALSGAYCSACGQPAHLHRSLAAIGHEILHAVFHFDGKLWRTLPELAFFPGRLTRRYIDGERAKFISPMALYLFTVFLMYAVFSFTGGALLDTDLAQLPGVGSFQGGNRAALDEITQQMADLRRRLESAEITVAERAEIERAIAGLESSQAVMEALASGDLERAAALGNELDAPASDAVSEPSPDGTPSAVAGPVRRALEQLKTNPSLIAYKVKTNGYKFSWALVPLSIPFMWLLFFWRRDIHLYDHAVFVTYSISFMMLLLIVVSLLGTAGASSRFLSLAAQVVPAVHMYKQLRGAYALTRLGALVRLFFLLIAAAIVLTVFVSLLLVMGVLG